jgi:hypothetical protein
MLSEEVKQIGVGRPLNEDSGRIRDGFDAIDWYGSNWVGDVGDKRVRK